MFTGLIQDLGQVIRIVPTGNEAKVVISSTLQPFILGESIAINGACLSVESFEANTFCAHASAETMEKTCLGTLAPGEYVNLEKALKLGDPLGGHIVSGHVDTTTKLIKRTTTGLAEQFTLTLPEDRALCGQIASKGSIALDGVSLTVNQVSPSSFDAMIIPITLAHTTLGKRRPGSQLNLETDLLAKYISRSMEIGSPLNKDKDNNSNIDIELLSKSGFMR